MYIIATAWLCAILMMSLIEQSQVAGIDTLVFYGMALLSPSLWIVSTSARRRRRETQEATQDKADTTAISSNDTDGGTT